MRIIRSTLITLLLLSMVFVGWPLQTAHAATSTVTSVADAGAGTLRQAIIDANASGGADCINFDTVAMGGNTITLASTLPNVSEELFIDGWDTANVACGASTTGSPGIIIDGNDAAARVIDLRSANNTVRGLVIQNASSYGVYINGAAATGNHVYGNYIGTNLAGTAAVGNAVGVRISAGASGNIIGYDSALAAVTAADQRNVISGNDTTGIMIRVSPGNRVQGNYIGITATGDTALGNGVEGVFIRDAASTGNIIGSDEDSTGDADEGNVISGQTYGVQLTFGTTGNWVRGNMIGTRADGMAAIPNSIAGVAIDDLNGAANANTIGGTTITARNIISGNGGSGVLIAGDGVSNNVVQGNYIGLGSDGSTVVANVADGIYIKDAQSNTINANVISGNGNDGVLIFDTVENPGNAGSNILTENFIGTDAAGTAARGNGVFGVHIHNSPSTQITTSNVVAGNMDSGVYVVGADSTSVQDNYVGTNAAGADLGNGQNGIDMRSASDNATVTSNIVRFNGAAGLYLRNMSNSTVNDNTVSNNTSHGIDLNNYSSGNGFNSNTITVNGGDGIFVTDGSANVISQNAIFDNTGLGIDLSPDGVTPNDVGDSDAGTNNLLNFPDMLGAIIAGSGDLLIVYDLDTNAGSASIEYFSNSSCDPSNNGEGESYLTTTAAQANGTGILVNLGNATGVAVGDFITATATNADGTSEFSLCTEVLNSELVFAKNFSPSTVNPRENSTLTFTIVNPTPLLVTGLAFSDTLPGDVDFTGVVTVDPLCDDQGGAVVTPTAGPPGVLTATGLSIAAGTTCTISVPVSSATLGTYVNTTSTLTTNQLGDVPAASATLNVISPPTPQPSATVFDPAISKIGVLQPGQVGLVGEQIEWVITVTNNGNTTGNNIVLVDNIIPALQIDGVSGNVQSLSTINGQTVTVTLPTLVPGQSVTYSIFTTVLESSVKVDNTVCLSSDGGPSVCTDAQVDTGLAVVSQLPSTGETPYWRNPLMLLLSGFLSLIGLRALSWLR